MPVKVPSVGCSASSCEDVFSEVIVLPTIAFGTRVQWTLHPQLRDPGPYEFALEWGRTGLPDADDWEQIGDSAYNVFFMVDDEQRVYGKTNWTHYRVRMTTPLATYYSRPTPADSTLSFSDRARWAAMVRAQQKLLRMEHGVNGYLLKRKLFGEPCPENCVDELTQEITNPQCPTCHGTGFLNGYFEPVDCVYAALSQKVSRNELDGGKARGTTDDMLRVKATILAVPQLFSYDVWVDHAKDARWFIHTIQNKAEYKGVAIVYEVELRLAPYSHHIYDIEIDQQVDAIA
jgi:hypothetical protein